MYRIKEVLDKREMTQLELSELLGMSPTALNMQINGHRRMSIELFIMLAG